MFRPDSVSKEGLSLKNSVCVHQTTGDYFIANMKMGAVKKVQLNDDEVAEPGKGHYTGTFTPEHIGKHVVRIKLVGRKNTAVGGRLHRLACSNPKSEKIDISSKSPTFVRIINSYFDVGSRPNPKDLDDAKSGRDIPSRPRKTKLTPLIIKQAPKGKKKSSWPIPPFCGPAAHTSLARQTARARLPPR